MVYWLRFFIKDDEISVNTESVKLLNNNFYSLTLKLSYIIYYL